MKIKIKSNDVEAESELNDTETAKAIYEKLPIEGTVNTWGDEIYFEIPIDLSLEENAKEEVEKGDLAYWPQGKCFCIFFGRTPASVNDNPRAASKVNIFGKLIGDYTIFKKVKDGEKITIEKA